MIVDKMKSYGGARSGGKSWLALQLRNKLLEAEVTALRNAILKHQADTRYSDTPQRLAQCDVELYNALKHPVVTIVT